MCERKSWLNKGFFWCSFVIMIDFLGGFIKKGDVIIGNNIKHKVNKDLFAFSVLCKKLFLRIIIYCVNLKNR